MRWLAHALFLAALMIVRPEDVPPDWRPWTPIDLRQSPNLVLHWKVRTVEDDPAACAALLARAGAEAPPVPAREVSAHCHVRDGVEVSALARARLAPVETRCAVALRLWLWEHHEVQPLAREIFGSEVARIRHLNSFACRRIRTEAGEGRMWSEHATANAFDIAGFDLADTRRVPVTDWDRGGAEERFLRAAHAGLCRWFNVTLGPDYNAAHKGHFHADMGPYRSCR